MMRTRESEGEREREGGERGGKPKSCAPNFNSGDEGLLGDGVLSSWRVKHAE